MTKNKKSIAEPRYNFTLRVKQNAKDAITKIQNKKKIGQNEAVTYSILETAKKI